MARLGQGSSRPPGSGEQRAERNAQQLHWHRSGHQVPIHPVHRRHERLAPGGHAVPVSRGTVLGGQVVLTYHQAITTKFSLLDDAATKWDEVAKKFEKVQKTYASR